MKHARMTGPILALILVTVTISAVAQVLLKHGMSTPTVQQALSAREMRIVIQMAANPFIWLGLTFYGLGALLWLGVLARVDVGQAYPFVGLGFLLTMSFGVVFLGEGISLNRLAGTLLIVVGVILIARHP